MTDAMCNGIGCCARDHCLRYVAEQYWRPTEQFSPRDGYHCAGFVSHIQIVPPEWTKRIPELAR